MLTQIRIQRYKSLYDVTVDLEPLTIFIGPNGSGKSNVCGALKDVALNISSSKINTNIFTPNKFWHGQTQSMVFYLWIKTLETRLSHVIAHDNKIPETPPPPEISKALNKVIVYDFNPALISNEGSNILLTPTGQGLANTLAAILLDNRDRFNELEQRFIQLVPNIARISLKQNGSFNLRLVDKYSNYVISAEDISDGTLRLLAFLAALYDVETPSIICFEEPENGVHPWLLHKMIELLTLISTEGITGQPVQVLITTHSPVLLNYVKAEQVRAVELDHEGKTQIHCLPTETAQFQAAMEAYDGELGELWFTNLFGGNPT